MSNVNLNDNVRLTLFNEYGEQFTTNYVNFAKGRRLRFITDGNYGNNSPFTFIALHGPKKVYKVAWIKPVLPIRETIIEVSY